MRNDEFYDLLIEEEKLLTQHAPRSNDLQIIKNLILRKEELKAIYDEIESLSIDQKRTIMYIILDASAYWAPEPPPSFRQDRNRLIEINQLINKQALELSCLLEERDELHETTHFTTDTHYSICKVISAASYGNHMYEMYVEKKLSILDYQFDNRYWPSISSVVHEIGVDAINSQVLPDNELTEAATASKRPSLVDFIRVFLVCLERCKGTFVSSLPINFKLKDDSLAAIANSTFNLNCEDMVDAQYVKRARQRIREQTIN